MRKAQRNGIRMGFMDSNRYRVSVSARNAHAALTWLVCLALALGIFVVPNSAWAEANPAHSTIAVVVGTTSERVAESTYPEATILKFDGLNDAVTALQAGKADYVVTAYTNCVNFARHQEGLAVLDAQFPSEACAISVNKSETALLTAISDLIEQYQTDGTLDALVAGWIRADGSAYAPAAIVDNAAGPELNIAISAEREPMCFVADGEFAGLDIQLARMLCRDMGYRPVFHDMKFSAMIPSVLSDKTPLAISNISATEERRESVDFSPSYFENPQMLLTRAELASQTADVQEAQHTAQPQSAMENALASLDGQPVGIQTGTVFDTIASRYLPGSEQLFYNTTSDQIIALTQGIIACFPADEPVSRQLLAENKSLSVLPELLRREDYAIAFPQTETGERYRAQMNEYLAKRRADGSLEQLISKWMEGAEGEKRMEDIRNIQGENGTIKLASSFDTNPFSYISGDRFVGYEPELIVGFCREYGYGLQVSNANFSALIPGLVSGAYDMIASCITITPERAESVLFSNPIYNGGVVMVVRAEQPAAAAGEGGFFASLAASFEKNFIRENRWELLASGIGITLLISVCSAILGAAIGFGVCMLRRNKKAVPSGFAKVFIRVIQGTPVVVLLMILYYVVLNKTGLDGVGVAIIAFGVNFGAYAAEILRSGLDAVDPGQLEAAAAIGFSKAETFRLITLPQAARHFLPVLKGEFISLVKMTSVVGYVAVQDLTKASDIIRSRTYEAFFPLIVTAVLYFLLAWGLSSLLTLVEVRTDPKHRKLAMQKKNAVKGEAEA